MRRSDREVRDFAKIVEIIKECDVCRLALNDDGYPYILPLNFGMAVNDGVIELYFHGAAQGTKYRLIEEDNRASFEMDCAHRLVTDEEHGNCTMEYKSVIGQGRIEILPDLQKYKALSMLMMHYHKSEFKFDISVMPATTVFKLVVENVTGKARIVEQG